MLERSIATAIGVIASSKAAMSRRGEPEWPAHQPIEQRHRGDARQRLRQVDRPAAEAQHLGEGRLDPEGDRRLVERDEACRIERIVEQEARRPAARCARRRRNIRCRSRWPRAATGAATAASTSTVPMHAASSRLRLVPAAIPLLIYAGAGQTSRASHLQRPRTARNRQRPTAGAGLRRRGCRGRLFPLHRSHVQHDVAPRALRVDRRAGARGCGRIGRLHNIRARKQLHRQPRGQRVEGSWRQPGTHGYFIRHNSLDRVNMTPNGLRVDYQGLRLPSSWHRFTHPLSLRAGRDVKSGSSFRATGSSSHNQLPRYLTMSVYQPAALQLVAVIPLNHVSKDEQ